MSTFRFTTRQILGNRFVESQINLDEIFQDAVVVLKDENVNSLVVSLHPEKKEYTATVDKDYPLQTYSDSPALEIAQMAVEYLLTQVTTSSEPVDPLSNNQQWYVYSMYFYLKNSYFRENTVSMVVCEHAINRNEIWKKSFSLTKEIAA